MEPRRLVFFASADPRTDPAPVWRAYHFADAAAAAGVEAEVRLAGDAVVTGRFAALGATPQGTEIVDQAKARRAAGLLVSL